MARRLRLDGSLGNGRGSYTSTQRQLLLDREGNLLWTERAIFWDVRARRLGRRLGSHLVSDFAYQILAAF
jgi:hypothetical protein